MDVLLHFRKIFIALSSSAEPTPAPGGIETNSLVKILGIDPTVQQDAQVRDFIYASHPTIELKDMLSTLFSYVYRSLSLNLIKIVSGIINLVLFFNNMKTLVLTFSCLTPIISDIYLYIYFFFNSLICWIYFGIYYCSPWRRV